MQTLPADPDTAPIGGPDLVGLICAVAALFGIEEFHAQCPGTGPGYVAGYAFPTIPTGRCGCGCHPAEGGTK